MYRVANGAPEVLLIHPGGPFWMQRDAGAWSVPKGEIEAGEAALEVARREFREELGQPPPETDPTPLGSIRQAGGKIVHAWAAQGEVDTDHVDSMMFEMEWPPHSGSMQKFPEVDRAAWFRIDEARRKILPAQATFLDRLLELLERVSDTPR